MYVRSYGDKPKITQKEPNASPVPTVSTDSITTAAERSEKHPTIAVSSEDSFTEATATELNTAAPEENRSSAQTELCAIPRQPIRRRKMIRKRTELEQNASEAQSEQKSDEYLPCLEERTDHTACDEAVHPDCGDKNTENRSTLPPNALSCGCTPQREQCKSGRAERKTCGAFSTEEMLLGGLIILLMNDGASDDILIILAFLLVSGFSLQ